MTKRCFGGAKGRASKSLISQNDVVVSTDRSISLKRTQHSGPFSVTVLSLRAHRNQNVELIAALVDVEVYKGSDLVVRKICDVHIQPMSFPVR